MIFQLILINYNDNFNDYINQVYDTLSDDDKKLFIENIDFNYHIANDKLYYKTLNKHNRISIIIYNRVNNVLYYLSNRI